MITFGIQQQSSVTKRATGGWWFFFLLKAFGWNKQKEQQRT